MANEVRITRKGGGQDVLVFGDEVREALLDYMLQREKMTSAEGHESALFLSLQDKRMSVRSIELLVKKYAKLAAPLKKISPHKLRSTYGTMLYNETGDCGSGSKYYKLFKQNKRICIEEWNVYGNSGCDRNDSSYEGRTSGYFQQNGKNETP